ncbi:oxidoreductase [Capsulimonas corticalis]|uniref:Oxidoreductase n=1 Tax=Capsulimonas corticalis TaxID=2219043 RepID=A0A402D1W5_9BACT|nr:aldo/keto reductase [Capsulimonas corticalis]BDI30050.1 oxidoreductase [Capsulimonas corticalis]
MQTRRLGNSDLEITPIGFGAWAIGGAGWAFGWGEQDDQDSVGAIRAALDAGINWIDTAAVYGLGHSEEIVAKALQGVTNKPYVFTKCSRVWDDQGAVTSRLKADSIRREIEGSLKRLQTDAIDLYQIHWPRPDEEIEEAWTTLAELKSEGKVRWIGVSNFSAAQMKRAQVIAPITSLQPPYSLLAREIEDEILPYAAENNIGVLVYSPMQSGLLSGSFTKERAEKLGADDWRSRNENFQEPKLSSNLELVELLREIGSDHGRTPGEIAIAWTLRDPVVTAAIVGARRPNQIAGIIGAADFRLSQMEITQIDAFVDPAEAPTA